MVIFFIFLEISKKRYNIYNMKYYDLRNTQKSIMLGTIRSSFKEISQRNTFQKFADLLLQKYFKKSVKKELETVEIAKRLFVNYLILAPLLTFKWLYKPGMHAGHIFTWIRRNVNAKNFFYLNIKLKKQGDIEEITNNAVNNAMKYCKIANKNMKWLEEELYFITAIAETKGLKAQLAKKILDQFYFLDLDFQLQKELGFNKTIREKKILKAQKKDVYSYFRVLDNVFIMSYKKGKLFDKNFIDLRKEKGEVYSFIISCIEENNKFYLEVKLDKDKYSELKAEIKSIIDSQANMSHKLFSINKVCGDFIEKYKYAYSSKIEFFELNRCIRKIVRRKIAPTLGPTCLKHLYIPSAGDLTNDLYMQRINPFWDLKIPQERYIQWWTPYILQ